MSEASWSWFSFRAENDNEAAPLFLDARFKWLDKPNAIQNFLHRLVHLFVPGRLDDSGQNNPSIFSYVNGRFRYSAGKYSTFR
jgi:hypothetical protein